MSLCFIYGHCYLYKLLRYSWIERAALLPAPIACITVAAPVTISPPANTPRLLVIPVLSSATILPFLLILRSGVVWGTNGLGPWPIAIITVSTSISYSEPLIGIGLLRPDASGSPSSYCRHIMDFTQPFLSPLISTGLVRSLNWTPSSLSLI